MAMRTHQATDLLLHLQQKLKTPEGNRNQRELPVQVEVGHIALYEIHSCLDLVGLGNMFGLSRNRQRILSRLPEACPEIDDPIFRQQDAPSFERLVDKLWSDFAAKRPEKTQQYLARP